LGSAQGEKEAAGEKNGPRTLAAGKKRPKSRKKIRNHFPIFQIPFSKDFQIQI
jgi:hypothetical protein